MYPLYTITDWLDQVLPLLPDSMRPIEAIQNAGDLMYVPEGWSHAVVNIDDTVAVSFQRAKPAVGGPYETLSNLIGALPQGPASTYISLGALYELLR